ncbi:hypothetical protein BJ170DRAFT_683670 [Xylariales sp. AK1849]|nr:hypothetical protein BJ170DRAFT_683670 [Xylariales sp. AK1849]
MSGIDRYASNGTCYWASGEKANRSFIPCGNVALDQNWQCCGLGDVCLSSGACYDASFGAIYLAGCTDSSYGDTTVCPHKGQCDDQQWLGIVTCGSEGEPNAWTGCDEPNGDGALDTPNPSCLCSGKTPLFTDNTVLTNFASLPKTASGHISYFPGSTTNPNHGRSDYYIFEDYHCFVKNHPFEYHCTFYHNVDYSFHYGFYDENVEIIKSGNFNLIANDENCVAPGLSPSQDPGLSTGAKAGIGVSVAGTALITGLFAFLYLFKRRRSQADPQDNDQPVISHPPSAGPSSVTGWAGGYKPSDEPESVCTMQQHNYGYHPDQQAYQQQQHSPHDAQQANWARWSNTSELSGSQTWTQSPSPPSSGAAGAGPQHSDGGAGGWSQQQQQQHYPMAPISELPSHPQQGH